MMLSFGSTAFYPLDNFCVVLSSAMRRGNFSPTLILLLLLILFLPSSSSFFMPSSTPYQSSPTMGPSTSYLLSLSPSSSLPPSNLNFFLWLMGWWTWWNFITIHLLWRLLGTELQSRGVGSGERGISAALSFPFLLFFLSTFPVLRALGRLESGKLKRMRPGHSLGLPLCSLCVHSRAPLSPLHLLAPRRGVVCPIGRTARASPINATLYSSSARPLRKMEISLSVGPRFNREEQSKEVPCAQRVHHKGPVFFF